MIWLPMPSESASISNWVCWCMLAKVCVCVLEREREREIDWQSNIAWWTQACVLFEEWEREKRDKRERERLKSQKDKLLQKHKRDLIVIEKHKNKLLVKSNNIIHYAITS